MQKGGKFSISAASLTCTPIVDVAIVEQFTSTIKSPWSGFVPVHLLTSDHACAMIRRWAVTNGSSQDAAMPTRIARHVSAAGIRLSTHVRKPVFMQVSLS